MKKEINTLIFSGGGVKGLAYIGILKKIEELSINNKDIDIDNKEIDIDINKKDTDIDINKIIYPIFNIKHICTVSAGSIFGLTYLLKYSSDEITQEVLNKKFERLRNIKFSNLISHFGIDSGNNILLWLENLIINKGYDKDITLKQFYVLNNIQFDIIATNLNKYEYTIFNYLNTPNVKVTDAIRMSIGIPFVFTVVKYDIYSDKMGNGDIHVDGGLIESYPIHLFKNNLENVLGFKLLTGKENIYDKKQEDINSIEQYIYHVLSCFASQRNRKLMSNEMYKDHTIYIDTKNITSSMNFCLSSSNKKKLIEVGYLAATKYFEKT